MEVVATSDSTKAIRNPEESSTALTRLDWSIPYNRASLHLSNQLRGKRFPADQLVLFDDNLNELPVEVQERAKAAGIDVIGFDLSVPQQRAFEAALYLINASGRQRKIRIRPQDWINACQLRTYDRKDGKRFFSQQEREDSFKALLVLAVKPWLMFYHKMDGGRQIRQTRLAPLWKLTLTHQASTPAASQVKDVNPDYIGRADWFEIEFEDIWFDQLDSFYLYKPRNLFERIYSGMSHGEKIPSSLHLFLEWVFSEAGKLRNKQNHSPQLGVGITLRADWREIALQCRLHAQLKKRNHKRVMELLTRNAMIAHKAGMLDHFNFEGTDFIAGFNPRQFEELESYLKSKRRPKTSKAGRLPDIEPPPFNPKRMGFSQVQEAITLWKREREKLSDKVRYRTISATEQIQIRKLSHWIKSFEAFLLGRSL